ncbi:MAG TPA: TetR/AcrR family transcriptional regulator [Pseudonocardia sp.]|nr:TetR/AcrR family transcriptional regulator [Pseudonocardia sp.]
MPRPPELSPRKTPRQQRSREMVARIIDAAARVLTEHGYDGASTNRIAATAGISSGSLYQYFPNKDAIVTAVLERFSDQLVARIDAQLAATMTMSWRDGGRALLAAQFEVFEQNIGPLRTIIERVPQLGGTDSLGALQRRLADLTRLYLVANRDQFRPDLDVQAAVWIMVEVSAQLAIRYLVAPPPIPREQVIDELSGMFIGYLTRSVADPPDHTREHR